MKTRSTIVAVILSAALLSLLTGLAVVQGAVQPETITEPPDPIPADSAVRSTDPLILDESAICSADEPPAAAAISSAAAADGATVFTETFDGEPASPQPFSSPRWDVTVHSRDVDTWDQLEPMEAGHGSDCSPPPATHTTSSYEDAVYICRNHVMTAINAPGYGLIYLTPNHLVDFSQEEAVIRFDVSTLRTSERDWLDVWITPPADHLQLALDDWLPDLSGDPRNAVHVRMSFSSEQSTFTAAVVRNFESDKVPDTDTWTGYEEFLEPSATRRDTFEIRLRRDHIKVGMPDYDFWWVDNSIEDLGWDVGVVQFGHHSYTPEKDCDDCAPNTWHWDNITMYPAIPFTMERAQQREATPASPQISFEQPAVEGALLRFAGIGSNLEVSFDDGSWQPVRRQPQEMNDDDTFSSHMMPIPPGTTQVQFRGENWYGGEWRVRDISWWHLPLEYSLAAPNPILTPRSFLPYAQH
jgi:hypothetical protein